jgi:hypothetical protein
VSFNFKVYMRVPSPEGGTKALYVAGFRSMFDAVDYVRRLQLGPNYLSVKSHRGVIFSNREASTSQAADYTLACERYGKLYYSNLGSTETVSVTEVQA